MATNKVQEGDILRLTVGSTVDSGDAVVVGNALRGVALTDYDSVDGKASIAMNGVYDLSVTAVDDAGNSTVAIGDRLYTDGTTITKKKSGKLFGIAVEGLATGTTGTINVLIAPVQGPDQASHQIFAAGIYTVDDSPLAAAEFIPVTGILATDVVLCTLSVNGGSPQLYIISAVAAASPAGITVTASGTFTAGDKINYAVLRAGL
jgi:predicted RecA/RadA family phage recombinase